MGFGFYCRMTQATDSPATGRSVAKAISTPTKANSDSTVYLLVNCSVAQRATKRDCGQVYHILLRMGNRKVAPRMTLPVDGFASGPAARFKSRDTQSRAAILATKTNLRKGHARAH